MLLQKSQRLYCFLDQKKQDQQNAQHWIHLPAAKGHIEPWVTAHIPEYESLSTMHHRQLLPAQLQQPRGTTGKFLHIRKLATLDNYYDNCCQKDGHQEICLGT